MDLPLHRQPPPQPAPKRSKPRDSTKARGTKRPRLTRMEIQESNRLRIIALRTGWSVADIAAACQMHYETAKAWMAERSLMGPIHQALLKKRYPEETR